MEHPRFAHLLPVTVAVGLLVLTLMVYAAILTADWTTFLVCAPAIVVTIAIVSGMTGGVILFNREEDETAEEASRPGGVAVFDRVAARIEGW